jgi:hypothetical protein
MLIILTQSFDSHILYFMFYSMNFIPLLARMIRNVLVILPEWKSVFECESENECECV